MVACASVKQQILMTVVKRDGRGNIQKHLQGVDKKGKLHSDNIF